MHQFQDKRTGTATQLPLGISYVTDFNTYDAQLMQNFHAQHVQPRTPAMQEPWLPLLPPLSISLST
jgi:hypothetical protein